MGHHRSLSVSPICLSIAPSIVCLCLARSCDGSAWGGACGSCVAVRNLGVDLAVGESCNIWDFGACHGAKGASGFSACWFFALFLVGRDVEKDEEDEVGGDYSHACECSELFSSTVASVWHPEEVGRGEVCVGCEVDETCKKKS